MLKMTCPRCWGKPKPCQRCANLREIDDLQLSKNFKLSEFLDSEKARTVGISNDINLMEIARLKEATAGLFQPARDLLGPLNVTSGFRSLDLNRAIGGAKNSAHMQAFAMDAQPLQLSLAAAMVKIADSSLVFDQVIMEMGAHHHRTNDDWIHFGWRHPVTRQQRRQLLVMENGVYRSWIR